MNLLSDGSFEALRQDQLREHWFVETDNVHDGKQALRFHSEEAVPDLCSSGYFQSFVVDDARTYAVTVSAQKIGLTGPDTAGYDAYMVLKYYDRRGEHIAHGSAGGDVWNRCGWEQWIPFINYLTPPKGAVQARLEPYVWKCRGTVLIDAVSVVDLGTAPAPAELTAGEKRYVRIPTPEPFATRAFSVAQKKQGFVTFVRAEPGFVFPQSYPHTDEITTALETYAARGECRALAFAIYPFGQLRNLHVDLADLTDAAGNRIPRNRCRLQRVRYWPQQVSLAGGSRFAVIPEILEPMRRQAHAQVDRFTPLRTSYDLEAMAWTRVDSSVLEPGQPHLLWLSVDVPKTARPGVYVAGLRVFATGLAPLDLTLTLKVLPFELVRPNRHFLGFYLYDHRFDDYSDEALESEFRTMHDAGVEAVLLALENRPDQQHTEGYRLDTETAGGRRRITTVTSRRLERVLAAFGKAGMRGPIIIGFDPMLNRAVAKALNRPREEGADMREWSAEVRTGMVDALKCHERRHGQIRTGEQLGHGTQG